MGHVLKEVMNALPPPDWRADVIVDPKLERTVVTANRECLLLAIRNLHENAVDHVPQRGMIRWSCETTHPGTTIFVEDNGPGIPEEELSSVTNRFFRGRNKSTLGSGLGLSIVDLALRTSGARLNFRNRPDARGLRAEMVWNAQSPVAGTADLTNWCSSGPVQYPKHRPYRRSEGPGWRPLYLGSARARAEQNREEGRLRVPALSLSLDVPWAARGRRSRSCKNTCYPRQSPAHQCSCADVLLRLSSAVRN